MKGKKAQIGRYRKKISIKDKYLLFLKIFHDINKVEW